MHMHSIPHMTVPLKAQQIQFGHETPSRYSTARTTVSVTVMGASTALAPWAVALSNPAHRDRRIGFQVTGIVVQLMVLLLRTVRRFRRMRRSVPIHTLRSGDPVPHPHPHQICLNPVFLNPADQWSSHKSQPPRPPSRRPQELNHSRPSRPMVRQQAWEA